MTNKLTKKEIDGRLLEIIFGDNIPESDCNHCPHYYECLESNPDGNANYCLVKS